MKVPDYIWNLINREVNPHLESGKRYDDIGFSTREPHILVDAIFSIVEDEETFNKFMRSNDGDECLGKLSKADVAKVTKRFMELMKYLGAELTDVEEKRLSVIEEFIEPEKNISELPRLEKYDQSYSKVLFTEAMKILKSRQEIEEFMCCQQNDKQYNGFSPHIIYKYIVEDLIHFLGPIAISDQIYKSIECFSLKKHRLTADAKRVDSARKLNPEFEESIFQAINEDDSPDKMAFDIYTAFNSRVRYDNNVLALGIDMSNQSIVDIYEKRIEEITKENNDVSCKSWAEAYAYLLAQKGFEAYVVGARIHRKVVAFKGTAAIEADGTAFGTKKGDELSLNDIVRSKLGVRPEAFVAYTFDGESHAIDSIDTLKMSYDEERVHDASKEFEDVKKQIIQLASQEGKNLSGCITALENPQSTLHSAIKKILFVNQMLNEASLDSSGEVAYARYISDSILSDEETKILSVNYNFFKGFLFPASDCIRTPIISINLGDPNTEENYIYFLLDHESHSFQPISKQEIEKRVVSGMLSSGIGIIKEGSVPGMPYITDLDWVVRARSEYILKKKENRNHQSPGNGNNKMGELTMEE